MNFLTASRLRRTCHGIDELVHQNATILKFSVIGGMKTKDLCLSISQNEAKNEVWQSRPKRLFKGTVRTK